MFFLLPKQKGGFSRNMFILPAVIAMIFGLMYILYRSGFAVMNRKYALLYTEYPRMGKRRSCIEARFLSCSGVTKRVIRLPRSRRYQFVFSSNTTKGSVCVEIYGTQNALMATLNNEQPCLIISTEEKTGYRVVTKFKDADGEYRLIWKECRSPKESAQQRFRRSGKPWYATPASGISKGKPCCRASACSAIRISHGEAAGPPKIVFLTA